MYPAIRLDSRRNVSDNRRCLALAFHAGQLLLAWSSPTSGNPLLAPPGAEANTSMPAERGSWSITIPLHWKKPRQLTVSAIYTEMKEGRGPVYCISIRSCWNGIQHVPTFRGSEKSQARIEFQRLLGGFESTEGRKQTSLISTLRVNLPGEFMRGPDAGNFFPGNADIRRPGRISRCNACAAGRGPGDRHEARGGRNSQDQGNQG